MSRYRRVNIDGKSLFQTETRIASENLLPGTFAVINEDGEFEQAESGTLGRVYVIDCAHHQGLGIRDAVPEGSSAVGNYVEEAREMAVLVSAGSYSKDQPITVGASGRGAAGASNIIGYCQDDAVLSEADFIRVRMRAVLTVPAVVSVTVTPDTASIEVSETVQLSASVLPAQADQGINWTSSDPSVATVSATGLVTGVLAGNATITATSSSDGTKSDTAAITVTA